MLRSDVESLPRTGASASASSTKTMHGAQDRACQGEQVPSYLS